MWFAGLSYVRLFRVKMERASACDGPYPNTTQHCNLLIINNTLMSWTFSLNMHNFLFFYFLNSGTNWRQPRFLWITTQEWSSKLEARRLTIIMISWYYSRVYMHGGLVYIPKKHPNYPILVWVKEKLYLHDQACTTAPDHGC